MDNVEMRKVELVKVDWVKVDISPADGKLFFDGEPLTFNGEYIYWG